MSLKEGELTGRREFCDTDHTEQSSQHSDTDQHTQHSSERTDTDQGTQQSSQNRGTDQDTQHSSQHRGTDQCTQHSFQHREAGSSENTDSESRSRKDTEFLETNKDKEREDLSDASNSEEQFYTDSGECTQIGGEEQLQGHANPLKVDQKHERDRALDERNLTPGYVDEEDMENDPPRDRDVMEETSEEMEEQSSDDTEFAIIDRDPEDTDINVEREIADSEDEAGSDEENEFSIVNRESAEASADDTDRDVSDLAPDRGDYENGNVRRPVDLFDTGGNARQKQAFYRRKARRIEKILSENPVDVSELRQQAISQGGLLNAEFRQKAWPLLLNVNTSKIAPKPDEEVLKGHRDYTQVVMDVNRSIKRFPPGMEETHRLSLQDKLVDVIMRVLVRHPELHYYQGFHDICVTFLLVVDEDLAFALVEKLSQSHLRDFMEPTMERTQQLLDYVPCLIRRANPELLDYLEGAELGNVFCVSWLLTWFGHVLNDIASILRIYDFFIACHPLMPVYVLGAVVLYREKEIFATEQDMACLYQLLTKVPDNLPFEHLLSNAGDLYLQYPPTELANEAIKRFKRAQEKAAEHRAEILARQKQLGKRRASLHPDGNVTFTQVTVAMLGAVASVAVYALYTGMEWDWSSWIPH